jgi:cytochrome P450
MTAETMAPGGRAVRVLHRRSGARRAEPGDDLISALVHSEIDGERLGEFDLVMFCMSLVAGNETTRNLLSHGALALATHPEERALLRGPRRSCRAPSRRCCAGEARSRASCARRTRDTASAVRNSAEGDRVLLLYASANRDESVFGPTPRSSRVPGRGAHVAFGYGIHFCLGAQLARMEARIAFAALLARFARWELTGNRRAACHPCSWARGGAAGAASLLVSGVRAGPRKNRDVPTARP